MANLPKVGGNEMLKDVSPVPGPKPVGNPALRMIGEFIQRLGAKGE